jgi:HAMP domain-containing protein
MKCHSPELSPDPRVRGVIRVTTSLSDLDAQIRQNTLISLAMWVAVVAALTFLVILGMRRLVLTPLQHIGAVAGEVGLGNLDTQVTVASEDEIGALGRQINRMIIGLRERLKLTSSSPAPRGRGGLRWGIGVGGEKRTLTVLSATFAASLPSPSGMTRMKSLRFSTPIAAPGRPHFERGGDVDQFVGDETWASLARRRWRPDAICVALDIIAASKRSTRRSASKFTSASASTPGR